MAPEMNPEAPARSPLAAFAGRRYAAAAVAAVLLGVLGTFFRTASVSAEHTTRYHEHVRALTDTLPFSVGDWIGTSVETPASAVALLHPNVLVNRRYTNVRTGEVAHFLFVQCSDARDLLGHYPPKCYPGQGLIPGPAVAKDWHVGAVEIPAMRYTFRKDDITSESEIVVDNFMLLPTGRFGRDMRAMDGVAKDRRLRLYGAAQVQVLTSASMSEESRDACFRSLVEPALPLFAALSTEALGTSTASGTPSGAPARPAGQLVGAGGSTARRSGGTE